MVTWLGGAAIAAIAGSPHCVGMCGPLACAAGDRPAQHAAYHAGRVATYMALGAASGAFGSAIPGPPWLGTAVAAALLVGFAASLAGLLPEPHLGTWRLVRAGARLVRRADLPSRLAFGAINGLLPCGLVYATLALAVSAATPARGALVMGAFGLFTVPALAAGAFGLRRVVHASLAARRALALGVLATGLGTLWLRSGIGDALAGGEPSDVPACHRPPT
jgi:uncharacterized protein